MLRAHLLRPALLGELAGLAAAGSPTVWLVWHHPNPPPATWPIQVWSGWAGAAAAIHGHRALAVTAGSERDGLAYRDVLGRARREARLWRNDQPRQRRFTEPACALGAVLQRLTIDAVTPDEVQTCLRTTSAASSGPTLLVTWRVMALTGANEIVGHGRSESGAHPDHLCSAGAPGWVPAHGPRRDLACSPAARSAVLLGGCQARWSPLAVDR